MAAKRAARTGRSVAGTIGLVFGGLWFSLGAMGLPRGLQLLGESMGFLVTIALIATLWSRRGPAGSGAGLFRRRGYIVAVTLEVVAIYAASARPQWTAELSNPGCRRDRRAALHRTLESDPAIEISLDRRIHVCGFHCGGVPA